MSQKLSLGNKVKPTTNVVALNQLIKQVVNKEDDLPGMAVFYGPPGFGKTFGCIFAQVQHDAIHITIQKLWTKKTLLSEILRELSILPGRTLADMMRQVNEGLAIANRPRIIDEADYAVARGMIEIIRDIHDGSQVPVILIGMEEFPQKLQRWELVDSRVLVWLGAEPASLRDVRLMFGKYDDDFTIDDAMLDDIRKVNNGNARRIMKDLAYVIEISRREGTSAISSETWGNRPYFQTRAPAPRRGIG